MNNQSLGSSSLSDTSYGSNPVLLIESIESTTNAAMHWVSQEAVQIYAISSEAHALLGIGSINDLTKGVKKFKIEP
jgi:hypothetical protein